MYRASKNPPTTAWARHLDKVMRDRDWSRVQLFEDIGPDLGYAPKSRSAILPLLEDKEPTPSQAGILAARFGAPPPEVAPAPTGATETPADLVAAIHAQTEAINALVAVLAGGLPARVAILEPVVRRLAERVLGEQLELPVPQETAG